MNFRFLFDPKRQLFAIGYRLADADGAGRLDASYYDLLASEARLASFIAIAKGDVPEMHWFHLGRSVTSVRGAPVLLSWSATLFEYLMPLLVMRTYPNTLLDESCRLVVRRQMDYAAARGVPWGISESAYNLVDRHGTYQYKAFGVPGLGLKRGLGDEVVVAPYATALAVMIDPAASTANLRRLAAAGLEGEYGFFDAIDYTRRGTGRRRAATARRRRQRGVVVPDLPGAPRGHDARRAGQRAAGRSHGRALSRGAASPGDRAAAAGARAARRRARSSRARSTRCAWPRPSPSMPVRRFRSPHTPFPHTQFLSNGNYVTSVTNAGGGASVWRGLPVTRWRRDATRDADGQFIYLRDVRSGAVWSADLSADAARARRVRGDVLGRPRQLPAARRRHLDAARRRGLDRRRRRGAAAHGPQPRHAHPRDRRHQLRRDRPHVRGQRPRASGVRQAVRRNRVSARQRGAALPSPAARSARRRPRGRSMRLSLEGRPQGPLEWETDRARFLGRGRSPGDPQALDGRALSGTTGVVLDPIVSLRQRIRLPPGATVRLCFATGMASDRETVEALARKYHDPSAAARTFALALTPRRERPAPSGHLGRRGRAVRAPGVARARHRRLASRAAPTRSPSNELGQSGLWPHAISGDLPILLVRVDRRRRRAAGAAGAAGAGVLAAEGPERRRRDRQRASGQLPRRDAGAAHGRPRRRPVEHLAASAGRRVPAARRPHGPRRARAARSGRAARSSAATAATCARSSIGPDAVRPPADAARADGAAARRRRDDGRRRCRR